ALSAAVLLSEVKEATERVSGLVAAMKSYAQLDRASLQFIDVTEGIDSTLVMLRQKLGDGVTVVREYGTGVPRIEANPADLNQVWTNLIDNAIDAMDASGTLRISTRADAEHVVIEIADTGPGMPAEVLARAFEAFYTTKDVGKGAGLGLDIARRRIGERPHGQITGDSRPGQTVFSVQLPRRHGIHRLRGQRLPPPGAGSGAQPRHGAPRPHGARFSVRCTYPASTDLDSNATAVSMGIPRLGAAPEMKLNR